MRALLAATAAFALATPASAQLFNSQELERVRTAVEAGRILPVDQLVQRVEGAEGAIVLELELEEESGAPSGWTYEVEVLTVEGQREIEIDAGTGEIVDD